MNPTALLALLADLYEQIATARQRIAEMEEMLAQSKPTTCSEAHPGQDVYHPEGH